LMSAGLGLNVRVTEGLLSVEVFVNPAPVCVLDTPARMAGL